ncbi:hypothetical protein EVAR_13883_1 [Eumeta japonica]|uniref:Endonuclease/exonuclease/phosphatase domain-containing protein n=1 Tax=Eumeta variegata TaxID=151549 RepID=A0A4C1U191_EUMVA|nr:hypothetical protein EVAR_13883_1 [Eumeta japonica]
MDLAENIRCAHTGTVAAPENEKFNTVLKINSDRVAVDRVPEHRPVYTARATELLQSDLESLLTLGEHVILFGDFNSKNTEWNCVSTNKNGRILAVLRDKLEFDVIMPLTPTHFSDKDLDMPDILDIAFMRNVTFKLGCIETLQRLSSEKNNHQLEKGVERA